MNATNVEQDRTRQAVRDHYGKIAEERSKQCCEPSYCNSEGEDPAMNNLDALGYAIEDIKELPEGAEMSLGCGNPVALAALKEGERVLDLGSGGGVDCFLAARKVGPTGWVIGVDMTPTMISKARENAQKGSFANVEFRLGEIEALPVADGQIDAILSNCVINLSPDKPRVYREAHRVLKKGGRLSIADIVATREIPEEVAKDLSSYVGCVSGAAPMDEIESMLHEAGFSSVVITPREDTREQISELTPSSEGGVFVVAALIEAIK